MDEMAVIVNRQGEQIGIIEENVNNAHKEVA